MHARQFGRPARQTHHAYRPRQCRANYEMEFLMSSTLILSDLNLFSEALFEKMKHINAGINDLELYEFRYGLNDLIPEKGWASVKLDSMEEIETRVNSREFYNSIQIKPKVG